MGKDKNNIYVQNEDINKKIEITKRNQKEILELKSVITEQNKKTRRKSMKILVL